MFGICRKNSHLNIVLVIAIALVSGCASRGNQFTELTPVSVEISKYKKITVSPSKDAPQLLTEVERSMLTSKIIQNLKNSDLFFDIRKVSLEKPDWGDLKIEYREVSVKKVSSAERVMLGIMAGQAELVLEVSLIEKSTGNVVGKAKIVGKSDNGSIFSGGTNDAIDEAAKGVVKFLKKDIKI